MGQMIENLQYRLKSSSTSIVVLSLRLFVGYVFGLTMALASQRMIGFGDLSFYLVITVLVLAFLKISKAWNFSAVLVFSLVCVLIGLLLRMYILVAPGA